MRIIVQLDVGPLRHSVLGFKNYMGAPLWQGAGFHVQAFLFAASFWTRGLDFSDPGKSRLF